MKRAKHRENNLTRQTSQLSRRRFLQAAAGASALALGSGCSWYRSGPRRKPNIIVILSDDHDYPDLVGQGSTDIPMPYINSLAQNGVRFSDGYVTCPVCGPSRVGLLTGRYQQRFGAEDHPAHGTGIPATEPTLSERLKPLGYATGVVGKWHVGDTEGYRPQEKGFDEFFGFLGGGHYFIAKDRAKPRASLNGPILRGEEVVEEKEYLTDAFGREAVSFIERHRDEPFFLYLPFNAVHLPLEATDEYLERVSHIENPGRRTMAAMTVAMDDAVGRILETLRTNGLEEDTLIFFLSDNGGLPMLREPGACALRNGKGQLHEGGIRVPFVMQWKGVIP